MTLKLASLFCALLLIQACTGSSPGDGNSTGTRLDLRQAEANLVGIWSAAPYGPYPLGPLTQKGVPLPGAPMLPNAVLYIPDLLHPNPAGFAAIGNEVNLDQLLMRCRLDS